MSNPENQSPSDAISLTREQVAEYLKTDSDFFVEYQHLLEVLVVPHESGSAVSFVERQSSMLREKNKKLTLHLSDFCDAARHNDVQFEKTKRMVLALLDAQSLDDLGDALEESLCRDFFGDATSLILFSDNQLTVNNRRMMPREMAGIVEPLMLSNIPSCGNLSAAENHFLFADRAPMIQSAAVIPLVQGETIGLLGIGSYDAEYFQSSQGTMFLSYVGEVLSRVASRILHSKQDNIS
ncbi:MAG: DUF484 family protein [Oceanospirillaceae bacterium]|nr:DUF484 family protein [Oceanospirillaceae bacterium]